jgi:hypothetical protein
MGLFFSTCAEEAGIQESESRIPGMIPLCKQLNFCELAERMVRKKTIFTTEHTEIQKKYF